MATPLMSDMSPKQSTALFLAQESSKTLLFLEQESSKSTALFFGARK